MLLESRFGSPFLFLSLFSKPVFGAVKCFDYMSKESLSDNALVG